VFKDERDGEVIGVCVCGEAYPLSGKHIPNIASHIREKNQG